MQTTKTTKYFGDVQLDVDTYRGSAEVDVTLNGQKIRLTICGCENAENLEKNLPFFWQAVDKYMEIYEKTKKAIIEYYDYEGNVESCWSIPYFFEELFGYKPKRELREVFGVTDFKDFDIKTFVGKMKYPSLTLNYGYGIYGLDIYVGYTPSDLEHWYDKSLNVVLDKNLKVKNFCEILDLENYANN